MSRFRWGSQHDIYLPEVDAEHRSVFRAAEDLQRAVAAGADSARVESAFRNLLELTEEHFVHEERLMKASRYAGYAWHRSQHDTARKRVKGLDLTDTAAVREAIDFLGGWLRDHTGVADRIMAAHLRNHSRTAA